MLCYLASGLRLATAPCHLWVLITKTLCFLELWWPQKLLGGVEGVRGAPGQPRGRSEGQEALLFNRCNGFRGEGTEVQVGRIRENFQKPPKEE